MDGDDGLVDYEVVLNESGFVPEVVYRGQHNTKADTKADCSEDPIEESEQSQETNHEEDKPSIRKWSNEETNFLLDMYHICSREVGPLKKFNKKQTMWKYIAYKINIKFNTKYNGKQVETRYKCVMKRTRKGLDRSNKARSDFVSKEQIDVDSLDEFMCTDFQETKQQEQKKQRVHFWGNMETNFMLNLFDNCSREVGRFKRFSRKKDMWRYIANKINAKFGKKFNALQVETRFTCVKRRKMKKTVQNITSESQMMDEEKQVEVNEVENFDYVYPDSSVEPENDITIDPSLQFISEPTTLVTTMDDVGNDTSEGNAKNRSKKTNREKLFERYLNYQEKEFQTLLEDKERRHREKEKKKEERHKEKMKLISQILKHQIGLKSKNYFD